MGSKAVLVALLASVALLQTASAGEQKLGDYLAGRAAQRQNDWAAASAAMTRALEVAPPDAELRHNTLLLAIAAGDITTAARIAATAPPDSNDAPIAALTLAVDRLAKGDVAGAAKFAEAMPSAGITHLARPLLLARFIAASGDLKAARAALDPLFEIDATRDLGELEASRLGDGLSPLRAAARGLSEYAGFLASQAQLDPALLLSRLALRLVPDDSSALTRAAEALARQGRPAEALALFDKIPAKDAWSLAAVRGAIDCLQALKRDGEARARAENAVETNPADIDTRLKLGDLLRKQGSYAEAAAAYDTALGMLPSDSPRRWIVLYARGASRERIGDWDAAEADLLQSLALKPETPTLLNFIGFAWAERGVNLVHARELLERAVKLAPEDGAIADSLGWTLYRQGEFTLAVGELERAVSLEPSDGAINDHLGDAYWRVGRTREAEFQWERAARLATDPVTAHSIETKLQQGLAAVDLGRR
jgi:tetratricopeptide (TPR) repeat protein